MSTETFSLSGATAASRAIDSGCQGFLRLECALCYSAPPVSRTIHEYRPQPRSREHPCAPLGGAADVAVGLSKPELARR